MSAAAINVTRDPRGWPLRALGVTKHRLRRRWRDRRDELDDLELVVFVDELLARPTDYYPAQALGLFAEVVMVSNREAALADGEVVGPVRSADLMRAEQARGAQARLLTLAQALRCAHVGGDPEYRAQPGDRVLWTTATHVLDRVVVAVLCDGSVLLGHAGRPGLGFTRATEANLTPYPWRD